MANFLYDTFTEASDTTLASHTSEVGGTWQRMFGASAVVEVIASEDRVHATTAATDCFYLNNATPPTPDYRVTATARHHSSSDASVMLVARGVDNSNYYVVRHDPGGAITLQKISGGSATSLGSASLSIALNTDFTIELTVNGTSIFGRVNGTVVTATDTAFTSAGRAGLRLQNAGRLDNISADDVPPGLFFSDTFTEATDTALASHTAEIGGGWTKAYPGTSTVYGGLGYAAVSSGTDSWYLTNVAAPSADYEVTTEFSIAASGGGLTISARTANSAALPFYLAIVSASLLRIMRQNVGEGAMVTLASSAHSLSLSTPYTLVFRVDGSNLKATCNALTVTATDALITQPGKVGYRSTGAAGSLRLDSIQAQQITPATATSAIPTATISTASASAIGGALAQGVFNATSIVAPLVLAAGAANVSTALTSLTVSGLIGNASGGANAATAIGTLSLSAPEATGLAPKLASGLVLRGPSDLILDKPRLALKLTPSGRLTLR